MTEPADAEREVGIEAYATTTSPCPARARSTAEDFVVEEKALLQRVETSDADGLFPLYRVEKSGIDTMHMARELSRSLRGRVSVGGLKDKHAATVQYATPTSKRAARPSLVVGAGFRATLVGFVPAPFGPSSVEGNSFFITLRDCCPSIERAVEEAYRAAADRIVPNYFGLQRFGTGGAGTHRVGEAIVARRFQDACMMMLTAPRVGSEAAAEAFRSGMYGKGAGLLPQGADIERLVAEGLARKSGDWVGALRAVPLRLRRFYVQAFQSFLFNKTVSLALRRGLGISSFTKGDNWCTEHEGGLVLSRVRGVRDEAVGRQVPMVQLAGYAFRDYGSRFDACLLEVMEGEGTAAKDFFVEEMQEVSAEGGFRRPHIAAKEMSCKVDRETARLGFTLGKGQYATVLLREAVKPRDPASVGLA